MLISKRRYYIIALAHLRSFFYLNEYNVPVSKVNVLLPCSNQSDSWMEKFSPRSTSKLCICELTVIVEMLAWRKFWRILWVYCGFLNIRWTPIFVYFVVKFNHKIKCSLNCNFCLQFVLIGSSATNLRILDMFIFTLSTKLKPQ